MKFSHTIYLNFRSIIKFLKFINGAVYLYLNWLQNVTSSQLKTYGLYYVSVPSRYLCCWCKQICDFNSYLLVKHKLNVSFVLCIAYLTWLKYNPGFIYRLYSYNCLPEFTVNYLTSWRYFELISLSFTVHLFSFM